LSNQYGNTGIEFRRLQVSPFAATNNIPFVPDPDNQPTSVGRASTNEIDVMDPAYDFPMITRGNLAYDRSLPWGLTGTVELLFANDVKDIAYRQVLEESPAPFLCRGGRRGRVGVQHGCSDFKGIRSDLSRPQPGGLGRPRLMDHYTVI